MPLTITISDDLAARLESQAAAEQMPVEAYAQHVLAGAVESVLPRAEWREVNRRRLALIKKRFDSGLTSGEEQELQSLHRLADQQFEELDARLLQDVEKLALAAQAVVEQSRAR